MRIQYISDLHLEFLTLIPKIPKVANILCLAGDIGYPYTKKYKEFLKYVNSQYDKIFLISGNHEYYNEYGIEITNKIIINNVAKFPNIVFLNNTSYFYQNYLFVGSTLWTHIDSQKHGYNDFNMIENMTLENYNNLHKNAYIFLNNTIQQNKDKQLIILTHHLPSFDLINKKYDKYANFKSCFASNCDDLIINPVKLWIYGHTHSSDIKYINNIPLICNPIGYPGEHKNIKFDNYFDVN